MMKRVVTKESVERLLNEADTQEHVFWGKEVLISYKLKPSNYTVTGRAATSEENFDLEVGNNYRGFADNEYRACELAEFIIGKPLPEYRIQK